MESYGNVPAGRGEYNTSASSGPTGVLLFLFYEDVCIGFRLDGMCGWPCIDGMVFRCVVPSPHLTIIFSWPSDLGASVQFFLKLKLCGRPWGPDIRGHEERLSSHKDLEENGARGVR